MDLGGWLRSLGLEEYEATFRENAINEMVLPNLTAEDLKDMGVNIVGHRSMLLDAIALLRADGSAKAPPAYVSSTTPKSAQDTAERRQVTVMFSDLVGSTALRANGPGGSTRDHFRIRNASRRPCAGLAGSWPSTWAMACWCISATRRPMRMTQSGRYGPGWN